MNLNLGVVDVVYTDGDGTTTTGDVAGYLESRYHIMRIFLEENEGFIHDCITNEVAGAIEIIAQGKRVPKLELRPAMSRIEERFRDALDSGELHRILPQSQQVSDATLKTSSRKKVMTQTESRQAFIDSGLFQNSFLAWVS
ncbi:hypothetical protein [Dyella caseinilytica]|uniref:Uncharacterized protein n=1 Tax=Dyella caseinilytica TaxID=1849581 RepID=A0ABX7GXN0_9GAMM|nr:hypothetical protein [Dyella caseinilytica]QRN55252.1 hypothetical protein ISN74_07955 [Dyella caseinilytica]GGA00440.1 hypothetical protein GCM10011408_21700 [Dyella caseinilytica]